MILPSNRTLYTQTSDRRNPLSNPLKQSFAVPNVMTSRQRPASRNSTTVKNSLRSTIPDSIINRDGRTVGLPLNRKGSSDASQILAYLKTLQEKFKRMPAVRQSAANVLRENGVTQNNEVIGAIRALTSFVKQRVVFLADPESTEFVISPVRMLEEINNAGQAFGDCDDHTLLLSSLLGSIGLTCRLVAVKINGSNIWNHVVLEVSYQNRWMLIDPCAKGFGNPNYAEKFIA